MKASNLLSAGGGLALYEELAASVLSFQLFWCLFASWQLCLMEIIDPGLGETGLPMCRVVLCAEDSTIKEVHRHGGGVVLENPSGRNAALDLL